MNKKRALIIAFAAVLLCLSSLVYGQDVNVYFFHQETCSNCIEMEAFLKTMKKSFPAIEIIYLDIEHDTEAANSYLAVNEQLHITSAGIPLVMIGEYYWVGAREEIREDISFVLSGYQVKPYTDVVGQIVEGKLKDNAQLKTTPSDLISLPFFGDIHLGDISIAAATFVIAFIDGLNPCSLWVLTLVLGMALHAKKRRHVLVIGLFFLIITAMIYGGFLFGVVKVVTVLKFSLFFRILLICFIGFFAVLNIKDYFAWKEGISFSITAKGKKSFLAKLRTLMNPSKGILPLIIGTAIMAVSAALIELPCTAGFPVLWAQILSEYSVPAGPFWWYLALYLLVYLLDEIIILVVVTLTLKRQVMDEKKGRLLKLVSGSLMMSLTIHLVFFSSFIRTMYGLLSVAAATLVIIVAVMGLTKKFRKK